MNDGPGNPHFQAGFFEAIRRIRTRTDPESSNPIPTLNSRVISSVLDDIIEDFARGQHNHAHSENHPHKRRRLDQPAAGTTTAAEVIPVAAAAAPEGTAPAVSGATEPVVAVTATPAATKIATLRVVVSAVGIPETAAPVVPVTASQVIPLAAGPAVPAVVESVIPMATSPTSSEVTLTVTAPAALATRTDDEPATPTAADPLRPIPAAVKPNFKLGLRPENKPSGEQWGKIGLQLGIGKNLRALKAMYLNGEFSIDGRFAATVPREKPCRRCVRKGLDAACRVTDSTMEERMSSVNCQNCIRSSLACDKARPRRKSRSIAKRG